MTTWSTPCIFIQCSIVERYLCHLGEIFIVSNFNANIHHDTKLVITL
jgi:hypothetical protein